MTRKTRAHIGGVPSRDAILRVVAGWVVIPLLIFFQSSRSQFVPFSEIPATIRGEVDFQAVGVEVQLTGLGSAFNSTVLTDWSGRFEFVHLRAGAYMVSVDLPGYLRIQEAVRADGGDSRGAHEIRRSETRVSTVIGELLLTAAKTL